MKSHTPECAKIEEFAATLVPMKTYHLCMQDFGTKDYTLELQGKFTRRVYQFGFPFSPVQLWVPSILAYTAASILAKTLVMENAVSKDTPSLHVWIDTKQRFLMMRKLQNDDAASKFTFRVLEVPA